MMKSMLLFTGATQAIQLATMAQDKGSYQEYTCDKDLDYGHINEFCIADSYGCEESVLIQADRIVTNYGFETSSEFAYG